jgi:hypothetical protein
MQKVEGVQTVKVSLKAGVTAVDLKPANKVTLSQLRAVIKNNGFVSKDAQIVARGVMNGYNFEVSGTREQLTLTGKPTSSPDGTWHLLSPAK